MKIDLNDFENSSFVFIHKNIDGAIHITKCEEQALPYIVEYFKEFLAGCGFHKDSIGRELGD